MSINSEVVFLSEEDFPFKTHHKNFKNAGVECLGYSMILTGMQALSIWIFHESQKFVSFEMAMENELSNLLKMEEFEIPLLSVDSAIGYLQHAGRGCKGYQALQNQYYMISDDV